jgi:hypothetical protein
MNGIANKVPRAVALLYFSRDVHSSNVGRGTNNSDWGISWYSLVPPDEYRDHDLLNPPIPFPIQSLLQHYRINTTLLYTDKIECINEVDGHIQFLPSTQQYFNSFIYRARTICFVT